MRLVAVGPIGLFACLCIAACGYVSGSHPTLSPNALTQRSHPTLSPNALCSLWG